LYEDLPKKDASTIKEAILSILSTEFPLTAKQLHFKVARLLNRTFSYQAFYKSLKEVVAKNVVTRHGGLYFLSQTHVQSVLAYSEQLKAVYGIENQLKKNSAEEIQPFTPIRNGLLEISPFQKTDAKFEKMPDKEPQNCSQAKNSWAS